MYITSFFEPKHLRLHCAATLLRWGRELRIYPLLLSDVVLQDDAGERVCVTNPTHIAKARTTRDFFYFLLLYLPSWLMDCN